MVTLLERLCEGYNVDDDPDGSIGHRIANLVYLSRKGFEYEERNKLKTSSRTEKSQKRYVQFYENWRSSRINENNFLANSEEKRKALLIFHKFSSEGVQSIADYSDDKIGSLYKKMLGYAKIKVEQ